MRFVTAYRANKILYNFILSNKIVGNVILPVNICPDVVDTLIFAGLAPIFVDISSDDYMIDRDKVSALVNDASLLVFVHTYGLEQSVDDFFCCLKSNNPNLFIVDDRCLCIPNIELKSSSADLVLYSMCSKKQVDMGVGGIGYIFEEMSYSDVEVPLNECLKNKEYNFDMQLFISNRDRVLNHKNRLNNIYKDLLPSEIQMPSEYQNWRFNIMVDNKDKILDAIFSVGLFASSHYKPNSCNCPVAMSIYSKVINLFNDLYFSEEQAVRACNVINTFMR